MDEICRFVRPYWKVPDTSLHLRESARERARRVAAPYYKPRVAEAVAETEAVVTGAPVASPWTRIHEIDAVFHLELFPLPRETARRSRRFREIRGSLSHSLFLVSKRDSSARFLFSPALVLLLHVLLRVTRTRGIPILDHGGRPTSQLATNFDELFLLNTEHVRSLLPKPDIHTVMYRRDRRIRETRKFVLERDNTRRVTQCPLVEVQYARIIQRFQNNSEHASAICTAHL